MMRSLFSGVSGLKNHQTRMDVIGNNISNVNTTGFKSSRVTFADTLNQTMTGASAPNGTLGGTNPKQVGLGSAVSSIDLLFTDGSVQSTGKNTDLCLSGNGLFVVSNGSQTYYTRNGAFEFDAEGNYVIPGSGLLVQGWTAKDGVLNTSDAVGTINVPAGKSMPSKATELVSYANNLNSAEETIAAMTLIDANTNTIDINSTDTTTYEIGTDYSDTISSLDVSFSNGINIAGASGQYAKGSTYNLNGNSTITMSNNDTISVPTTSTTKYTVDKNLPSTVSITDFSGGTATLSDGSVLTNNSNSAYTAAMSNGASLIIPASVTDTFAVGNSLSSATITSLTNGTTALLSNGSTLSDSNSNYNITINYTYIDSSSTTKTGSYTYNPVASYTYNSPFSITGSESGGIVTLSDATTFNLPSDFVSGFTISGDATIDANALNTSTVISSIASQNAQISSIAGKINSGDGTIDDFTMTSGSLTPKDGVTVSDLSLTGSTGTTIKISSSDTNAYKAGGTYTSSIKSTTLTMSNKNKTKITQTSGAYTMGYSLPITTTTTIYDTLGNAHSVTLFFTKTKIDSKNGNQWTVSLNPNGSGSTTIKEDDGTDTDVNMPDVTLQFDTNGKYVSGTGSTVMTLTNGSTGTQNVTVDLSTLTQYSGNNTVNASANGNSAGTLESVSIDSSGIITGTYTNGMKQTEAQVAVAQFTNASGLTKTGSSLYQESNNSGTANIKTAADLGVKITPSALEMSNVDIANEFADMIVTQRGFQSNSKIITVGDEMLETVINMKR